MKKAAITGAVIYAVGSVITILVCGSLRGGGENVIALLLFFPWVAVLAPARLVYYILGLEWRVGSYSSIPYSVIFTAVVLNSFLGALLGIGVWWVWRFTKRLFARNEQT